MTNKRKLFNVTIQICGDVNTALQASLGKAIWHISESDRYRLYKLWIWSQRYYVSLEYILSVLVPYFNNGVEKRTGKKSKGLGISIPVLTGDVAEEVLQKCISRDFPEGDHLSLYREEWKDKITELLTKKEFNTRIKSSLQFKSVSAEAKSYISSVTKAVTAGNKLANQMKKIPMRNNPWL